MGKALWPGSAASLIIEALSHKPRATQGGLVFLTLKGQNLVAAALSHLVTTKRVVIIGTLQQAQAAGIEVAESPENRHHRHDAKVYALPGTRLLPQLPVAYSLSARHSALKRARGSGQIAGRRTVPAYRWFVGWA